MAAVRILVVCTANVCRSPMAAASIAARLGQAGMTAQVTSAGTRPTGLSVDPNAVRSASELGFDIAGHQPRLLTRAIVDDDGADLVVTMTRAHLREVAVTAHGSFRRTFTMRELDRRLTIVEPATFGTSFAALVAAIASDRRPSHLLGDDPADDIADPYGTGIANVRRTAVELDELARRVAAGITRWGVRT